MKKLSLLASLIFICSAFCAVTARAQDEVSESHEEKERRMKAAHAEMARQELINLEKETTHALQLNNTTFFSRVYSDDFVGSTPSGQVLDKTGYLKTVRDSSIKYTVFVATDINVRIYQDTAVVTSMWASHGTVDGRPVDRQYRVTHVYISSPQGWRAVLSHETLLPH